MVFSRALLQAVLSLAVSTVTVLAQSLGESCRTPNNSPGTCVAINDCPPLLTLLNRNPTQQELTLLHRSRCGFSGNQPIVCCSRTGQTPSTTIPTAPPSSTGTNSGTEPMTAADVSRHTNLRLLPRDKCGPSGADRIFNGNKTEVNEFPWMVLLGYTNQRSGNVVSWKCGGSLINQKYVLTAAHCIFPAGFKLSKIRVGEHDLATEEDCSVKEGFCNDPIIDLDVEQVIPHPKYSKLTLKNDIAIVRMRGTVDIDKDLRPICLPIGSVQQNQNLDAQKLVVAGWGTTENGSVSSALLKVAVPVVTLDSCRRTYQSQVNIGPSQLCAGGSNGHDSCTGDSGGPLMLGVAGGKSVQFGVVSFGPKQCGQEGRPGVYTRVGYFMEWILDNMKP